MKIMVVQSIKAYGKTPVMPQLLNSLINSLTLFHNKIHDSHVCITLLRVKLGIKSVPDLQAKTLIIYAAYLHNYIILSVTSKEEFPRRRRQVKELYSPIADHPGGSNKVNFIKPVQAYGETAVTGI